LPHPELGALSQVIDLHTKTAQTKHTDTPGMVAVQDKLPPAYRRVIVVEKGCRCLGYVDQEGVWRDDAHHNQLDGVMGWIEL